MSPQALSLDPNLVQIEDYVRRQNWGPLPFSPHKLGDSPRVLLLKLSAIGDCLIASPVAQAVRERYPNAFIGWAVQNKARAVVEGNPFVDELFVWDGTPRGALALGKQLRQKKFEVVLNLQPQFKSAPILALCGAKIRVVTSRADVSSRFLCNRIVPIPAHQPHAGEQYLRVAHSIDVPLSARPPMTMPLGAAPREWADNFLRENERDETRKLVALNPASLRAIKAWPREEWQKLARFLGNEGHQLLAVGGPNDVEICRFVAPNALQSAGKTGLKELGALLERCDLLISADTGPMHIGAAVGTKILALFGPTDAALTGPLTQNGTVLLRNLPCQPCLQQPTCQKFECLTQLRAEEVNRVAAKLLA